MMLNPTDVAPRPIRERPVVQRTTKQPGHRELTVSGSVVYGETGELAHFSATNGISFSPPRQAADFDWLYADEPEPNRAATIARYAVGFSALAIWICCVTVGLLFIGGRL